MPGSPLDGFGVIRGLAPIALRRLLDKLAGVGLMVVLLLLAFGVLVYLLLPGLALAVLLLEGASMLAGW